MKLAINIQPYSRVRTLAETLEQVRSFGVNAIDIWPANLEGGETAEERERYECKHVAGAKALIDSFGMHVACVTLGFSALPICLGIGGVNRGTAALKGAVDAARVFGAGIVNCYTAGVPMSLFVDMMRPAAAYAEAAGVTIVLENEAHDDSAHPERVRAMVEAVGSPAFGTQYDPCNYYHAYAEPYPAAYEVVKDIIRYVHLKGGIHYDSRWCTTQGSLMRGRDDQYIGYVPILESAFNADAILQRLVHDGYDGYLTLEPHVPLELLADFYRIEVPYVQGRLAAIAAH